MKALLFLSLSLLLAGCASSPYFNRDEDKNQTHAALFEMRGEIADLKHALKSTQTNLQIAEERLEIQEEAFSKLQAQQKNPKNDQLFDQLSYLEKKLSQLERLQEKLASDLRTLNMHTHQAGQRMEEVEKEMVANGQRLEEVTKLKTTLTSISKAMHHPAAATAVKKHKIKPGETLEKIARQYQTSVNNLKKQNHLEHDRIVVGQELEIPLHE